MFVTVGRRDNGHFPLRTTFPCAVTTLSGTSQQWGHLLGR